MGGWSWRIELQRDRNSAWTMLEQLAVGGWLVEVLLRLSFLALRMRAEMVQEHLA